MLGCIQNMYMASYLSTTMFIWCDSYIKHTLTILFLKVFFFFFKDWHLSCCQSFFSFFSPKAPAQYIVVYSSCRSFCLCYVGHRLSVSWWVGLGPAKDPNQQNPELMKWSVGTQPLGHGASSTLTVLKTDCI